MNEYLEGIWAARYFWVHLAMSDLRGRWRRSFFGVLWSIIQPLGLTVLISIVFSNIFNSAISEYAPYILSGVIIWEYIVFNVSGGALAFVQADAYIKQTRHPLAIYTLRNVISGLVVLAMASISLVGWVLVVMPQNFGWAWLAALTIFPIIGMIVWPWATIMAYFSARFRDLPHALGLILQAVWFVSPIYFETSVFRKGNLHVLLDYNPLYHLLQIVRAPLLHGEWPVAANYLWCFGTIAVLTIIAALVGRSAERRVIFYL
ncbi:ABC transporter permease [Mesorhizobium sp. B1-1-9]|uniref:ABC transporter permease n=1 Tax=Mesorhizobium sp. B1-1-9 TaxID=2589975 RepID=UPI00112C2990|nr:ABC transporter permease [Mesorhizobium sp. B1-1-9]TPN40297.1 ABC transporter permease [Mesorhizobium sp. B1-1-9]